MAQHESFKIGLVGTGNVGMTAAYSLLMQGVPSELVLIGRNQEKVESEQLDLEHGLNFMENAQITASTDYAALAGTDLVIFSAGAAQEPGEDRLQLLQKNRAIVEQLIPQIVRHAPDTIILMVTNPVDVLTWQVVRLAGLPPGRVFGSGTLLDTARFRFHLSEFLNLNPRSIHTYILGEHGDSSFPALRTATVGGQPLMSLPGFSLQKAQEAYERARTAAYRVISGKGATYYAIATVLTHIAKAIKHNDRSVLPVSVPLENYYGHSGVALSVPCVVGRDGVIQTLQVELSSEEQAWLARSVERVRGYQG